MSDFETPIEGDEPTDGSEYAEPVEAEEAEGGEDAQGQEEPEDDGGLEALLRAKGIPDASNPTAPPKRGPGRPPKPKEGQPAAEKQPPSGSFDAKLAEEFKKWKEGKIAAGEDPDRVRREANSVAAQIRMRERENKVLRARLLAEERAKQEAAQKPQEETLPDPNVDPGAYAIAKLERLENMLREREEREMVQKEMERYGNEIGQSRDLAIQFRASNPPVYDQAVMHLASSVYEELADNIEQLVENGHIDPTQDVNQQLALLAAKGLSSQMVRAAKSGQNPGEFLYNLAVNRGYRPPQYFQQQPPQEEPFVPPAPQRQDPRAQISQVRQQQAKASSLAGVPGAGPGRLNMKRLQSMEDIDDYLDATKGVPMKELFRDKLIPGIR